jgi:serine phosphatase RsbU (regulator of sigma subunit)
MSLKPVFILVCVLLSALWAHANKVERLVDSIKLLNLYAHDSVKIRNYMTMIHQLEHEAPDTALHFINKAIELDSANALGNRIVLMLLKADILENQLEYANALNIYNDALLLTDNKGQRHMSPEINNRLGTLHLRLNMYEEAFTYFDKARESANRKDDPKLYAHILNNIGYTHRLQNQNENAYNYFKKALSIYKDLDSKNDMAGAYNNIGAMYFFLEEFDSVLVYLNKALQIYEELNDKKGKAFPIFNIGEVYYQMNNYNKAIQFILQSYEIDKEFNDKSGMAKSLHFLGKIYSRKGHYNYGLKLYEQSMDITLEINDKNELKDIYLDMSENYEKLGKYELALSNYKQYSDLKDQLFDVESANRILELETKYQTDQHKKEIENQRLNIEYKEHQLRQQNIQKIFILMSLALILVISSFIYRNYRVKNKSNSLLILQKEKIEQQNNKITSSIQYAKLIQSAALPPHDLMKDIFEQHFILFLPRDIVSGDFFWATHKGKHSVVVCADCTGHGVPGAFMSMLGVSFLTEIVNRSVNLSSDQILEDLRKNVIESLHQTGRIGESRDGMDIALCIVDHDNMQLEYSGAFIPLVIIRDNNIIQIAGDKMPIGVHDEVLYPFSKHTVKLVKGDMVYMFTDGYADQFGGPFNKKFKMQPFLSLLLAQHTKSLIQQRELLYDTIMSWKGDNDQVDDILVMGFKV